MSSSSRANPVCGEEALQLLNCVAATPYEQENCIALLSALRACIENKKVRRFSIAKEEDGAERTKNESLSKKLQTK